MRWHRLQGNYEKLSLKWRLKDTDELSVNIRMIGTQSNIRIRKLRRKKPREMIYAQWQIRELMEIIVSGNTLCSSIDGPRPGQRHRKYRPTAWKREVLRDGNLPVSRSVNRLNNPCRCLFGMANFDWLQHFQRSAQSAGPTTCISGAGLPGRISEAV